MHRSASRASARPTLVAAWRPRGGGPSSGRPSRAGRDVRWGGSCDDALEWCRWSASTSCSLFIDDRPWMPACLASAYSCRFDFEASTPFPLAGPSRTHQAPTCGSLSAPFRRRARKCGSLTPSPAALPRGEISTDRRLFSPHAHRVTYRANGSLGTSLREAQRSSVSKLFRRGGSTTALPYPSTGMVVGGSAGRQGRCLMRGPFRAQTVQTPNCERT